MNSPLSHRSTPRITATAEPTIEAGEPEPAGEPLQNVRQRTRPATPATGVGSLSSVPAALGTNSTSPTPLKAPDGGLSLPGPADHSASHDAGNSNLAPAAPGYEVGYGKPPKRSQFQKGQSGNSKGRPKASRNTRTIYKELLDQKREIKKDGKVIRVSNREAVAHVLLQRVFAGDLKALAKAYEFAGETFGPDEGEGVGNLLSQPSATDLAILAYSYREHMADHGFTSAQVSVVLAMIGLPDDDQPAGLNGDMPPDPDPQDSRHEPEVPAPTHNVGNKAEDFWISEPIT